MVEIDRRVVLAKRYALWSRMPMTFGRGASPVDNRSFVTKFIFMKTVCSKTINATITACDLAVGVSVYVLRSGVRFAEGDSQA
jgi:hypothetical protein